MEISENFAGYCRTLTDRQLENVLRDEWNASRIDITRLPDYNAAKVEADHRGWTIHKGERQ